MEKLRGKKLFLLDMDGTIYLGDRLLDGCLEFLEYIKSIDGRYMFLTNNSSKSVNKYVEHLNNLGIKAHPEDFFTSAQATLLYLQNNYMNKTIYALGTTSFKEELLSGGLKIVDSLQDDIDCLVMGFDTEINFQKLEDACILLGRGVDYIATNPDIVCPTSFGYVPDCGSISQILYNSTKREPLFIGKPKPEMASLALEKSGLTREKAVLIGDRIYTDIACGINADVSTILVLSGETTLDDLNKSEIKPGYVFKNILEIYNTLKSKPM